MVDVAPRPAPEAVDEVSVLHPVPAARPRHFPCFDGLRAIAAILVVLVHTAFASGFTVRSPAGIYTARLEIGVAVFFLISGFLLYRPFVASHIAGGDGPAVGKFWMRRFLRIVPAYWLTFIVTNFVMHIDRNVHPGWHSLLIYLGLLQVYFPSHALTGITQAWSLCTEVAFYFFLPLFA
ncbi:MAG TPA: acyltransferase, partial [Acidimicrobiales bacterium]|nr:acyltransferase [Acidimicrobiales bacterium]